ncbi:hypothetical protein [Aquimarina sp. MMG016]|uniref:hypothetical protein n=1 Tax=Aquimarina sp. MMG016 TaxID=2822690 RepID=UPI001FFD885A|nr:hypothetical protein [Aquimarina sp. MMG016]
MKLRLIRVKPIFIVIACFCSITANAYDPSVEILGTEVYRTGIGLGSVIAAITSWERNKSILWAILAGILSWIYVIYFALTRKGDEVKS